jgi:hypothetical protein
MLMRKVMAEQPVADAVLRAEAAVVQKEVDAARKVVAAEVLLMMQETLEMLVEREDVEAVAAESLALRRIQAIGASSSRTTTM